MIDYEVLEWCKMSPVERFVESQKPPTVFETPQNVPRETSCTILRLRNQSFKLFINGQHRQECFLWDFHVSYGFHPLFTFFLFFQKFSFPGNIAAITLGGYIFCNWTDRFPCNNPASYCRLQYNLKQMS